MKTYTVLWRIQVDADTPLQAAIEAQKIQRRRQTTATVFEVHEGMHASGKAVMIDLPMKATKR